MCYGYGLMMGMIARIFLQTQGPGDVFREKSQVFLILLFESDALSCEFNLLEIIIVVL